MTPRLFARALIVLAGVAIAALIAVSIMRAHRPLASRVDSQRPLAGGVPAAHARYVGAAVCAACHEREVVAWQTSHHAQAMQAAVPGTVLGDFNGAQFSYGSVTSRFFKRNDRYYVRTDGADGRLTDFEVTYTFGIYPLQQYLIAADGGRLQALGIAWDARPKAQGGQRWFHLYPIGPHQPPIKAGDALHWTARDQNWNFMCSSCHSTGTQKGYDPVKDTFKTTWSEIDVACEACHGPGSLHAAWAKNPATSAADTDKALVVPTRSDERGHWTFAVGRAIAEWDGTRPRQQADMCFPCHARRDSLVPQAVPGDAFLDDYRPVLLEKGIYHANGQILQEAFEYGSFVQSKMYAAGVTCTNCHDAHSLKLRAAGNALCTQCHRAEVFDRPEHVHHAVDSPGAQCVSCHMPQETYMGVHVRHDHGFRVPRPELTVVAGVPDVCAQCHADRNDHWAQARIAEWSTSKPVSSAASPAGKSRPSQPPLAAIIDAAWHDRAQRPQTLDEAIEDRGNSDFARTGAILALGSNPEPHSLDALAAVLDEKRPLLRMAALRALQGFAPAERISPGAPCLTDPFRSVRIEAARTLAPAPAERLTTEQQQQRDAAIGELIAADNASAERPEAHSDLAAVYADLGRTAEAESELKAALRLDPRYVPALVNLADLYRAAGRFDEGVSWLNKAIAIQPENAVPQHLLGLLLIGARDTAAALPHLKKAWRLEPNDPRYAYVYAVVLHAQGMSAEALDVLENSQQHTPANRDVLTALVTYEREGHRADRASKYAKILEQLSSGGTEGAAPLP